MVGIGQGLPVQGLQVSCQVVDALGIQELADYIRWLQLSNGSRETYASAYFSNFHVHRNHLKIFLKCKFCFSTSGVRPEILQF